MRKLFFIAFILSGSMVFCKSFEQDCDQVSIHYNSDICNYIESNLIFVECSLDCINEKHAQMLLHSLKQAKQKVNKNKFACSIEKYSYLLKATYAFFNDNPRIANKYKQELSKFNPLETPNVYHNKLALVNKTFTVISN